MKNNSRTTNTIYNFIASLGGQVITIIIQFIVRTVFIHTLGKSYLGIGGLFSNILSMLSIAELGVGSAILFKLYEPIKENNTKRISVLIRFYKTVYFWIGIIVAILGICLIPFLPILINDYDKLSALKINAVFIFLLYLFKTVSTYWFFAYKSAIIKANQKEYLITIIGYVTTIATAVVQIACMYLFSNFELYVVISVIGVIAQNVICAILANHMYPYIKGRCPEKLSNKEVKDIFKDCASLLLYKINGAVYKATDNIVLSAFLGLETVGMYTNYYVFYTTINTFFSKVFNSAAHSLGNLHASKQTKHEYEVFESVNFISAILGGTAFVGMFVIADEFVVSWIGNEWVIEQPFAFLMGLELYTLAMRISFSKYRTIMGLFRQSKFRPIASMSINLIVSIILVNFWGICGVLAGTIIADWTTFIWFDPLVVHKFGFNNEFKVSRYYFKQIKYLVIVLLTAAIDYFVCHYFLVDFGWFSVIVHATIVSLTVPGVLFLFSFRSPEGLFLKSLIKREINTVKRKFKSNKT